MDMRDARWGRLFTGWAKYTQNVAMSRWGSGEKLEGEKGEGELPAHAKCTHPLSL